MNFPTEFKGIKKLFFGSLFLSVLREVVSGDMAAFWCGVKLSVGRQQCAFLWQDGMGFFFFLFLLLLFIYKTFPLS